MKTRSLNIVNLPDNLPDDILREAVEETVQRLVRSAQTAPPKPTVQLIGGTRPRSHPFEGPEVNDDLPAGVDGELPKAKGTVYQLEEAMAEVAQAIGEDFPSLRELFRAKRENKPEAPV